MNTTDSAVRLTHIPTGIVVTCQNEKSQLQNKASAMRVLQARLLERKRQEEEAKMAGLKQDTTGSWGDQMRSYVLHPYQMVKDLRTEQETGNPSVGLRRRPGRVHRGRHPVAQAAVSWPATVPMTARGRDAVVDGRCRPDRRPGRSADRGAWRFRYTA